MTSSDSNVEDGNADSGTPLLQRTPPQHCSLSQTMSGLLQDWWLYEILGATLAVSAVLAIGVVLVAYDSSSLPDWPLVFTINSVVSLFGTITKLCMASAVAAAISQSKWLWYRQGEPRLLQDLQLFDDATRGPWGSTQLLFSLRARHLAFVGSLIIILTQFFDPFLQQVVVYPNRLVPSETSPIIVRTDRYEARSLEGLPLPSIIDLSMKAAIYKGLFNVKDSTEQGAAYTCPTGNCTWSTFTSLAVCNKCLNITDEILSDCDESGRCIFSLPNGPMLSGYGSQINTSVTNISSTLNKIQPSVIKFSSLRSRKVDNSVYASAMECAMWYCVNTYTATVVDGMLKQDQLSSWRNDSALPSQTSDLIYHLPTWFANTTANSSVFIVTHLAARSMNSFMSDLFTGSGVVNVSGSAFTSDIIQALYRTDKLPELIDNLAISMSNNIRQQNASVSRPEWKGTAWKSQTYVHVRWAWFAFPAGLVVLSLALLVGTIIETRYREVMIWKSNNLALLFHGRGLELDGPDDTPVNKLSQMTEKAKGVSVELTQVSSETWKFVQKR